jgi:hypothetical protein
MGNQTRNVRSVSGKTIRLVPQTQRLQIMIPQFIQHYINQYYTLLMRYWSNMTPHQYLGLLLLIALAGWLMMKSASKR